MIHIYKTKVTWLQGHWGEVTCSNGPHMKFSAPPSLQGYPGVLTPEDAFVAAVNMCVHMMFIWSTERYKIDLVSYTCEAEGFAEDLIDQTSHFSRIILRPNIVARNTTRENIEKAIKSALKYSLIASSIKSELIVEPQISVM